MGTAKESGVQSSTPKTINLVFLVLVPIALRAPAVFVLVSPPMALSPAALASLTQFAALVICLGAVSPMFLDSLVQFMLGVDYPTLASVVIFGVKAWNRGEKQCCRQYRSGKNRFCADRKNPSCFHWWMPPGKALVKSTRFDAGCSIEFALRFYGGFEI